MEELLRKFSEFRYIELRHHSNSYLNIMVVNGKPAGVYSWFKKGYSVRVFDGSHLLFFSSPDPNSIELKKVSFRSWEKGVIESKREKGDFSIQEKIKLESVTTEEKVRLLEELSKSVYGADALKSKVISANFYYTESREEKEILFEDGSKVSGIIPRINLYFSITLKNGDRSATISNGDFGGSGGFELVKNWELEKFLLDTLVSVDKVLEKGKSVTPGRKDVILSNQLAGIIVHESVGHPFEADRVLGREGAQAGLSYLVGRNFGEKIGSESITVIDDPTIYGGSGYYLIDDEGVKAKPKYLIKEGVINELLQDRFSAYKFGVESNGSARASAYDREPLVRMSNTFFKPGDYTFDELVEDVKDGVYLKSYMEWNIDDLRIGERYVGLEAYEIKDGEIGDPLLFPVLETTTFELLSSVDAVDNTLSFYSGTCGKGDPDQGIPVWFGGPNMRARNLMVKVRGE
ncbi:TldD/PmbA family protein [Stygiolobus caldivivus]|uniref:TldD/PmbA family protein n=1 Tax=Stygiolobus caldivivus TaxID=2824673 RepID=A0A8D5U801_9CREN|nr:TldD/PmbA family protein [Stygiolobus caldivivus]BCU71044.1 hypothetical protein KN1_23410 [Stygiolobus caldivivus]